MQDFQKAALSDNAALPMWVFPHYAIYQVGGAPGGECFLLVGDDGASALFDCGFAFAAPQTLANIQSVLGQHQLDWIVLTHSHYDHCAAAGYLAAQSPQAKIAAHPRVAYVFTRPGALATMRELDASHAKTCGYKDFVEVPDGMQVHVEIDEGDVLTVGQLHFRVLAAPGHTKDCLAFWCEQEQLLISCETGGVHNGAIPSWLPVPDSVPYLVEVPALVGFGQSLDFIRREQSLTPEVLVIPHAGVLKGRQEVAEFFETALFWGGYQQEFVVELANEGMATAEIVKSYIETFFHPGVEKTQPRAAFELNASYIVPTILRESGIIEEV